MRKLGFVVVVIGLVLGFAAAAQAQNLTAAQRAACQADFSKYCQGVMPGGGRIIACLNKQRDQLSDACRKEVDAAAAQKK